MWNKTDFSFDYISNSSSTEEEGEEYLAWNTNFSASIRAEHHHGLYVIWEIIHLRETVYIY